MSRIKLDLSQFKHVSSDDKTTTLRHKDGHDLKVVHSALSKEARGQLEALAKSSPAKEPQEMAEGGGVWDKVKESFSEPKPVDKTSPDYVNRDPNPDKARAFVNGFTGEKKYAQGGKVDKKKKGDEEQEADEESDSPQTIVVPNVADGVAAANEIRKQKKLPHGATIVVEKPKKYADGGMVDEEEAPAYLSGQLPEEAQSDLTQPITHIPAAHEFDTDAMAERKLNTTMNAIKGEGTYGQDPLLLEKAALKSIQREDNIDAMAKESLANEKARNAQNLAEINAQRAKLGMAPKAEEFNPDDMRMPTAEGAPEAVAAPGQGLVAAGMPSGNGLAAGVPATPEGMFNQGYQQQVQGVREEADAIGKLGIEQARIIDEQMQAKKLAAEAFESEKSTLFAERDALIQDVKDGAVDPNKFWTGDKDGNGGHSKVMAGIGMILAGFNPTNRPNAAIEYLQKQMDMNLQAQMRNLGSKETLLSHNLQQFRNIKDAAEFTRIQQNDMLQHQLEKASAMAKTPMAQAAAKQAAGKLAIENASIAEKFASRRAISQLSAGGQDPANLPKIIAAIESMDPEKGKEMRARLVPGLGLATTSEGAKGVNEMQTTAKTVKQGIARLNQILDTGGKSLSPNLRAEAESIRTQLVGRLRVPITGPGAMSDQEREMLLGAIPDVTALISLDSNSRIKLKSLEKGVLDNYRNMAIANGLSVPAEAQNPVNDKKAAALKWAKANPKDPRAAEMLKYLK